MKGIYTLLEKGNVIKIISPSGILNTLAGNGQYGSADGVGTAATFSFPVAVTLDNRHNLYVSDNENFRIRKIALTGYTIDKPLPTGLIFDPTTGTISGTPTQDSPATDYTVTAYNMDGSSSTVVNIEVITEITPPLILPDLPSKTSLRP